MTFTYFALLGPVGLAAAVGALFAWLGRAQGDDAEPDDPSGWVYFATGREGPVKIGLCKDEPTQARLPELQTMSPIPLRIVYKLWTPDRYAGEAAIHELLADYRQHGEWFDRDAALYYADHLRGVA